MGKELNREEQLLKERFAKLVNYGKENIISEETDNKLVNSTLIEYRKAGDGRVYGIVKENQDYFIKSATLFEGKNVSVEDFVYLGGLENKDQNRYNQLNETQKILNSKIKTINESFDPSMNEDEFRPEDEQVEPQPEVSPEGGEQQAPPQSELSPEGQPAPEPQGEVQPEVSPEGGEQQPSPESEVPSEEPQMDGEGDVESDPVNKAKSHIGKAGNYVKTSSDISSEMSKQLINMFLGYFDLQALAPEDKQEIFDKLNNKEEVEEDVDIQKVDDDIDMDLDDNEEGSLYESFEMNEDIDSTQVTEMVISLLGAISIFAGSWGLSKLMEKIRKSNPEMANKIEQLGKAAGDSIAKGSEKFHESLEINEEVAPDPQMIAIILSGVSAIFGGSFALKKIMNILKKKNPNLANKIEQLGKAAGDSIAKGSEKFHENDEASSEEIVTELAKKYNVTEQQILKTAKKFIQEEKIKKENQLKEERLKLTVRNIIKEKLGLKKRVIKEGKMSPTRKKLEEQVDKYLEKVNKKK